MKTKRQNLKSMSDRDLARFVRQLKRELVEIGGCGCGANDIACIVRCEDTGQALEMLCDRCFVGSQGGPPDPGKVWEVIPPMHFELRRIDK